MTKFRQLDVTDCGAACLGFIAAHFKKILPVAQLRRLTGTNQQGSTALGLVEAARALGFSAKGVKGPADALPTVPLPAIAHCLIDKKLLHYVFLVRWTPKHALIMDPAVGRVEKWPHEKFLAAWTGVLTFLDRRIPAWFRLELGPRKPRQLRMTAAAHFMIDRYVGFDVPATVSPPPSR